MPDKQYCDDEYRNKENEVCFHIYSLYLIGVIVNISIDFKVIASAQ